MRNLIGGCFSWEHLCDLGTRYEEDGYYTYCRICERENFTPYIRVFPVARPPLLSGPRVSVDESIGEIPF